MFFATFKGASFHFTCWTFIFKLWWANVATINLYFSFLNHNFNIYIEFKIKFPNLAAIISKLWSKPVIVELLIIILSFSYFINVLCFIGYSKTAIVRSSCSEIIGYISTGSMVSISTVSSNSIAYLIFITINC